MKENTRLIDLVLLTYIFGVLVITPHEYVVCREHSQMNSKPFGRFRFQLLGLWEEEILLNIGPGEENREEIESRAKDKGEH